MNENMLPVGTLLRGGTYKITRQLSSGGFGNTYVVENVSFDETYAMKEFFMKGVNLRDGETVTVSVPDNKTTFESQKEKLKKEACRLHQLHNSHIVHVHDLFEERGTVYYVMDYIEGESLSDRLKRTGKPLSEEEALDILRQVLDALSVVHGQSPQLLHLDIKPANIMIDRKGCAYLIDFGASKQLSADESRTLSTSTGMSYTAGYAPSEQIEQNYDRMGPWTDYYALGATLYRLLTLHQPPSPSEISEEPDEAFSFPSTISERTQRLIRWLMSPNRKRRPQSVGEIIHQLNTIPEPLDGDGTLSEQHVMNIADENTVFEANVYDSFQNENRLIINRQTILKRLVDNMVYVEGGTFMMGDSEIKGLFNKLLCLEYLDESPTHQVTLSSFFVGKYEVTQEEWEAVMGSNPSKFKGSKLPVEQVTWNDCQTFIHKLNQLTGKQFRLPTEAEWEYAARGGSKSRGYKYAGGNDIGSLAWYKGNSGRKTHEVGQKQPNELGLYDMSGNVWEWCQDWYGSYSSSSQTNPTGSSSGSSRVRRGGSWHGVPMNCSVSYRYSDAPDYRSFNLGLRLAL